MYNRKNAKCKMQNKDNRLNSNLSLRHVGGDALDAPQTFSTSMGENVSNAPDLEQNHPIEV